jgi:hypothetical protein
MAKIAAHEWPVHIAHQRDAAEAVGLECLDFHRNAVLHAASVGKVPTHRRVNCRPVACHRHHMPT